MTIDDVRASTRVVIESDRLLCTGEMLKSDANTGISGCTQYISAKVAKPAAIRARFALRYSGVPRCSLSEITREA